MPKSPQKRTTALMPEARINRIVLICIPFTIILLTKNVIGSTYCKNQFNTILPTQSSHKVRRYKARIYPMSCDIHLDNLSIFPDKNIEITIPNVLFNVIKKNKTIHTTVKGIEKIHLRFTDSKGESHNFALLAVDQFKKSLSNISFSTKEGKVQNLNINHPNNIYITSQNQILGHIISTSAHYTNNTSKVIGELSINADTQWQTVKQICLPRKNTNKLQTKELDQIDIHGINTKTNIKLTRTANGSKIEGQLLTAPTYEVLTDLQINKNTILGNIEIKSWRNLIDSATNLALHLALSENSTQKENKVLLVYKKLYEQVIPSLFKVNNTDNINEDICINIKIIGSTITLNGISINTALGI